MNIIAVSHGGNGPRLTCDNPSLEVGGNVTIYPDVSFQIFGLKREMLVKGCVDIWIEA